MNAETTPSVPYEPPAIEERTNLGMPLAGMGSGGPPSAVFRAAPRD